VTGPQIVWVCVGATGAVGLLAITIGLFRQVKRLGQAVSEFGRDVRPTLDELRRESERAQSHAERVAAKGQALQEARNTRSRR
jgi:hypothetical protein